MAITIDIKTTGVNTLERAAAAFDKMSSSSLSADKAFAALSATEQKLVTHFKAFATATQAAGTNLNNLSAGIGGISKQMSVMTAMQQPFTKLAVGTADYVGTLKLLQKELRLTAVLSSEKLGNAGDMRALVDAKAAIKIEQMLNVELEKQAALRAKNVSMSGGAAPGTALGENLASLKQMQLETAKLTAENEKLNTVRQKGTTQQIVAQQAMQGVAAAEKLVGVQSMGASATAALKAQMEGAAAAVGEYAKASMQGAAAAEKLIGVQSMGAKETAALKAQMEGAAAAQTKLTSSQINATAVQKNLQGVIRGTAGALGGLWLSYGAVIPMMVAFTAASTIKKIYEVGSAFEYMSQYAHSISDLKTPLTEIRSTILGMSGLAKSPTELAEGYMELQRAGYSSAESLSKLSVVAKYATLANLDMGTSIQQLVTLTQAFAKDGLTLESTANIVARAALASATTFGEMQDALKTIGEVGNTANISLLEVATAAELLADKALKGTIGTTALRTAITKLLSPTAEVGKVLKASKVEMNAFVDKNHIMTLREMLGELNRLHKTMDSKAWANFTKAALGIRAIKITSIIDDLDKFDAKLKELEASAMFIDTAFAKLSITAKISMANLAADYEKAMIKVFDGKRAVEIIERLRDAINSNGFASGLQDLAGGAFSLAEGFAGVVTEFMKLPTAVQEVGIVSALFFGIKGKLVAAGLIGLADAISNISWAMNNLNTGISLGDWASKNAKELVAYRKDYTEFGEEYAKASAKYTMLDSALDPSLAQGGKNPINNEIRRQMAEQEAIMKAIESNFKNRDYDLGIADAFSKETDEAKKSLNLLKRVQGEKGTPLSKTEQYLAGDLGNQTKYDKMMSMAATSGLSKQGAELENLKSRYEIIQRDMLQTAKDSGATEVTIAKVTASIKRELLENTAEVNKRYGAESVAAAKSLAKSMADLRAETAGEGAASRDADALVIIKKIKNEYAEMKELAKTAGESQVGAAERAQLLAVKLGIELDKNNKKHDEREGTTEQAEERGRAASAKFYLAMDKLRDEASPLSKEDARGNEIDRIFDEELASYKKMLTSKGEFRAADYQLAVKTAETLKEYYKSNDTELLRSHNNFFDAIKAGYIELKREAQGLGDVIADSMKGAMEASADAVAEFAVTGKLDFKSFTASVLADMSRMIVKQQALAFMNMAVEAVTSYFSGSSNLSQGTATPAILNASTYSAKGNVFSGAGISAYSNTIVDKPTMFGKGGNLMGEAGPEAILPLTRLPGGNLGVESSGSSGGGLTIVNNINVDKGAGGSDSEKEAFANRIARAVDQQVVETLAREKRYGGVLY